MEDINKLICASSLFILYYSMIARYVRNHLHLPDPFVTLLFGILIGHHFLDVLNTHYVYSKIIVLNFSRIVLCLQTMAISLKVSKDYLKKNRKVLFNLIVIGGIIKCFFCYILIYITTTFDSATSWALSTALTPTDPILSSSIVSGDFAKQNVPEFLRNLLNAESGLNDGIGIVLLNISLEIILKQNQSKNRFLPSKLTIIRFLINTIFIKVILSFTVGMMLGKLTKKVSKFCYKHQFLNSDILLIQSFALTFLGLSLMSIIDGSELICIFFSGIYLNEDGWYTQEQSNNKISDVIENSFFTALFVFFGSRIDFSRFTKRMVIIIFSVILIRIITILMIYKSLLNTPTFKTNFTDAIFIGFFGPIGVGAIYYSLLYDLKVDTLTVDYAICSVFISVILHGLAVPFYVTIKSYLNKIESLI
ncbi:hypothetical protein NUSPORA_01752 [Nucleospora cyclopteri]